MKKLLIITCFYGVPLALLSIAAIFFFVENKQLKSKIASLPEVGEMTPERDYKFFAVFKSNGKRFALVAKMKKGDDYHPPMIIQVGEDFPTTGEGFEQTYGFMDLNGAIKTL